VLRYLIKGKKDLHQNRSGERMSFIVLILLAFFAELLDSSLGMGYGTLLSPLLLILGFSPIEAVPAVLLSQGLGGLSASILHHKLKNIHLFDTKKKDLKIVLFFTVSGIVATIIGALLGVKLHKEFVKTYISILVLCIGFILLIKPSFKFSWFKISLLGIVAAFNKGISGGGFGPVLTGGQVICGNKEKSSVACTTLTEVPICFIAFAVYLLTASLTNWTLAFVLSLGAVISTFFGPHITKRVPQGSLRTILGVLILLLGAISLLNFKISI
jgi:uncharacterized protein